MVSSSNQTKPVSASSSPNAAFEESFENDVTFQSLIDSNNDNDSTTNFETLKSDGGDKQSPEDLNLFVRDLLDQMQTKFENMGNSILHRIDDMGSRIDTLEKSIGDLMDQSGLSESTYGTSGNVVKKTDDSSHD